MCKSKEQNQIKNPMFSTNKLLESLPCRAVEVLTTLHKMGGQDTNPSNLFVFVSCCCGLLPTVY